MYVEYAQKALRVHVQENGVVSTSCVDECVKLSCVSVSVSAHTSYYSYNQGRKQDGRLPGCSPTLKLPKTKFKKHRFCRYDIKSFT
jgi:hypothetical protein